MKPLRQEQIMQQDSLLEQAKTLLDKKIIEKDELIAKGKSKEAYFEFARACLNIMHTAQEYKWEAQKSKDYSMQEDGRILYDDTRSLAKESILRAEEEIDMWTVEEHELAASVLIQGSEAYSKHIEKALEYISKGIEKAVEGGDIGAECLIRREYLRAYEKTGDVDLLEKEFFNLVFMLSQAPDRSVDRLIKKQIFLALEKSCRYLGSFYSKEREEKELEN